MTIATPVLSEQARGVVALGLFYTYLHRRLDTGQVMYVGKGIRARAYSIGRRNDHWKNVARKCGFSVEIVAPWKTEAEAYAHEVLLIRMFREMGHPLTNKADGGEGPTGMKQSPETIARRVDALRARYQAEPEALARRTEAARAGRMRPDVVKRHAASMAAHRSTDAARSRQSELTKAAWKNAGWVVAVKASAAASYLRPEVRARRSAASKKRLEDPKTRQKIVANLLGNNAKNSKQIYCAETGEVFVSIAAAAERFSTTRSRVRDACRRSSGRMGDVTLRFVGAQSEPRSLD